MTIHPFILTLLVAFAILSAAICALIAAGGMA